VRISRFDRNVYGLPGMERSRPLAITDVSITATTLSFASYDHAMHSTSAYTFTLERQADGSFTGTFRDESSVMGIETGLWGRMRVRPAG
jgi:hypothetical protein